MKLVLALTAVGLAATLGLATGATAQSSVEMQSAPAPQPRFEIVPPPPATREATKPPEADFYREDIRVRHEPAFIEPFVGRTRAGNQYGLSGWTAPNLPVGSLASQGYQNDSGALAIGFTFLFDYPPKTAPSPTAAPR
jgi:hypothetical protein